MTPSRSAIGLRAILGSQKARHEPEKAGKTISILAGNSNYLNWERKVHQNWALKDLRKGSDYYNFNNRQS